MDANEFMASLILGTSNCLTILTTPITDPYQYSLAMKKAINNVDTIMNLDVKKSVLSQVASSGLELHRWLLPYSDGIHSLDFCEIRDRYDYRPTDVKSTMRVLSNLLSNMESTSPTRKCSIAQVARSILQDVVPQIDSWATID